jgi:ADP-ribosylglycohydrolase
MRVSPIAWVAKDLDWALNEAAESAAVTHNHPEGIKGAQAVVACVYIARAGKSKQEIKEFVLKRFGYDLTRTIESIRPAYTFAVSCQGSVPEAIIAFLVSNDFEDAIRNAISLGGDSDTIAFISGSIAHAFYGSIPYHMIEYSRQSLDKNLLMIVDKFSRNYISSRPS